MLLQVTQSNIRVHSEDVFRGQGLSHIVDAALTKQYLSLSQDAMASGQIENSRSLAQVVLTRAEHVRDVHTQGEALLTLAQLDVLDSRLSRAQAFSSRAASLFRSSSDEQLYADALSVSSYTASARGLNDSAQQLAALGLQSRKYQTANTVQVAGYNYRGVAAFWAAEYDEADAALEAAVWLAGDGRASAAGFHPLINQCFTEVLRATDYERTTGRVADVGKLDRLVSAARALRASGHIASLNKGALDIGVVLYEFVSCYLDVRRNRGEAACQAFVTALKRLEAMPEHSWLHSVAWWARLDLARARRDYRAAVVAARGMELTARKGEHRQMELLAQHLLIDLRVHFLPAATTFNYRDVSTQ